MSQKVTRKQILQNEALERRKYKRRLEKLNPSLEVSADVVKERISESHVDRLQNMLPPGIRTYGMFPLPKRKKINPRELLPYKPLKKFVHWLPLGQQDAATPVSLTKEIEEFAKYVSLDKNEVDSRENMIRELNETIMSKWSTAVIHQFGSYAVGLSTFMSDLDISILNMGVDNDDLPALEPPEKNNHIIQTVVNGSSGLAQLQASTSSGASNSRILVDTCEREVVDLTTEESSSKIDNGRGNKRKFKGSDSDESYAEDEVDDDSDEEYSKYNVQSVAAKAADKKNKEELNKNKGGQFVDLVSISDESDSEFDDDDVEVSWQIDTNKSNSTEKVVTNAEEDKQDDVVNDGEGGDWESSSNDSRDSQYETLSANADFDINDDDEAELNKLYEAEERAMADIDDVDESDLEASISDALSDNEVTQMNNSHHHNNDDEEVDSENIENDDTEDQNNSDSDSDNSSINTEEDILAQEEEDEVMQQVGQKRRRRRDSGDDDSYYSEGDIYSRHKQNELYKTIKSKMESSSSDNLKQSEDIEDSSSESNDNDSLTRLLLQHHGSDSESDEDAIDWNKEDDERDGENDDLEHSLIVGAVSHSNIVKSKSSLSVVDKEAEMERHKKELSLLRTLFPHIRSMNWLMKLELRSKARVPIINLQHKNTVECDISVGVSAQDTSHIVLGLKEFCGPALFALSCFLKVFLYQFDLDKPFSGGLGSYKLYVIIAAHVEQNQSMISDKSKPDLGSLLLSFLKYYGNPRHLNAGTVINVLNAEVSLDRTNRVTELQRLFEAAHDVLSKIVQNRLLQALKSGSSSSSSNGSQALIIGGNANTSNITKSSQLSSSALASLLNVEELCKIRAQFRHKCREYPLIPEVDLDAMAQKIVNDLERRLSYPKGMSVADIKKINPCLYARLRSFPSVDAAVRHLGGRDSAFAPPNPPREAYQKFRRVDSTKSLPAMRTPIAVLTNRNGGLVGLQGKRRDGEFKFQFNGVGGNHITDLPSATNRRVNNKPFNKSDRHSFGGFGSNSSTSSLGKRSTRPHFDGFTDTDFKKPKLAENSKKEAPVIVNRYNNPKSGFTFANQNYSQAPSSSKGNGAAAKVDISVAAKKLSKKISDTISDLKSSINKTKGTLNGNKKQKI